MKQNESRGICMDKDVYVLRSGLSTQYYEFGEVEHWSRWSDIKTDFDALRYMKKQKISWKAGRGGKHADQCLFSMFQAFSKRFIELLKENSINNFKPYKFKIIEPKDSPDYYYLDIQCKKIRKHKADQDGLMKLEYLSFDINDWGGEDLFTIEDTFVILCTEKVKLIVEKNNLKNFRFVEVKPVRL